MVFVVLVAPGGGGIIGFGVEEPCLLLGSADDVGKTEGVALEEEEEEEECREE